MTLETTTEVQEAAYLFAPGNYPPSPGLPSGLNGAASAKEVADRIREFIAWKEGQA